MRKLREIRLLSVKNRGKHQCHSFLQPAFALTSPSRLPLAHPYVLLATAALMWGGNAVAGKLAVGHISPFLLTTCRWALAVLILAPFAYSHLRRDWPQIRPRLVFMILLGATGFAVFNNLLYLALNHTTAINVAIEQASMPLFVFLLNWILFRTGVSLFQIIGFAITLTGVAVTVTRGGIIGTSELGINFGDFLMLVAVAVYGTYSVLLRRKPQVHVTSFIFVLALSALATSIPFTAYEIATDKIIWPDARALLIVVYTALGASLISQMAWVMGLDQIGSNRGGVFMNLVPIFGSLLAVVILEERFELYHGAGLILVLGGIALAEQTKKAPS